MRDEQKKQFADKLASAGYDAGVILEMANGNFVCRCWKHVSATRELDCVARFVEGTVYIYEYSETI